MSDAQEDRSIRNHAELLLDSLEEAVQGGQGARAQDLIAALLDDDRKAARALVARLVEGRQRLPDLGLELLPAFAGSRTPHYLRKIARDQAAPDIVRFGARVRLGWAKSGEGRARRQFLGTLRDDGGTLMAVLEQATRGVPYPPNLEILADILGFLLAMSPDRAVPLFVAASRDPAPGVTWLLRGLLHSRDERVRMAALERLVAIGDKGAAGAIERASNSHRNAAFRAQAREAIETLMSAGSGAGSVPEPLRLPPVHSAYLSAVDGDGGQVAIVIRQPAEGLHHVMQWFIQDWWGVKGVFGSNALSWDEVEDLYRTSEDGRLTALISPDVDDPTDVPLVEVDISAVREAIGQGLRTNLQEKRRLDAGFELFEPYLHSQDPPPSAEKLTVPELDEESYVDRQDLFERGAELVRSPFFQSWHFDPDETAAAVASAPRPRDRVLTDEQYRPIVGEIVDEWYRDALVARLRRQAWLLDQSDETDHKGLALAAAARLRDAGPEALARHPLLRAMVRLSLENLFGVEFAEKRR